MRAEISVLLVPPPLKSKFVDVEYPALQKDWKLPALMGHKTFYGDEPGVMHCISHAAISHQKTARLLEQIKPDRMIRRFVADALGHGPESMVSAARAEQALREALTVLQTDHTDLTLRAFDRTIWGFQSSTGASSAGG